MRNWNELSMAEKANVMKLAIEGGVYDLDAIRSGYNEYAKGGKIHIAPSKRGTFTAAASKHGKSVQAFASQVLAHPENYSPAMRKKANFARNAAKWKHGFGGNLFDGITEDSQQMQTGHAIYLNYPNAEGSLTGAARIGGIDIGAAIGKATGVKSLPFGHAGVILVDKNGNSDYYDYGRYKAGTDKHGVSTFGTIKKGKGNWRTKKLPAQKQGENDSVYVARIQGGLPDTEFGAYQAMSFPNINIEEARAYVTKQANDPNRRIYGAGNTCVDAAYRSIVPFMQDTKAVQKMLEPSVEEYNTEGYSPFAQFWSLFPWSVGNTSAKMRKAADKTYIMNKKK